MIHLNAALEGQTFVTTSVDPNTQYTCVGFAANETFLIVGSHWDQASNRSSLKTFKIQDVRFIGQLAIPPNDPSVIPPK